MICIFDLIAYKKYVSQGLYLYICVVFIACISCDTGKATGHYRMLYCSLRGGDITGCIERNIDQISIINVDFAIPNTSIQYLQAITACVFK